MTYNEVNEVIENILVTSYPNPHNIDFDALSEETYALLSDKLVGDNDYALVTEALNDVYNFVMSL